MSIYFCIVIFLIMLLLPVVGSLVYYLKCHTDILFISATKTKDPRFFAHSFDSIITQAMEKYDGGDSIVLSRSPEKFYFGTDELTEEVDRIVVSLVGDFDTKSTRKFSREVYVSGNAIVQSDCEVRALLAKGSLTLGGGSVVDRWVDAEGVVSVYDDCELGISVSSASHVIIGRNCHFRRIYAPVIDVATYFDELEEPEPLRRTPFVSHDEIKWGKFTIDEDDRDEEYDDELAGDDGVIVGTIITSHNIKVLEDLVVAGDIRSHNSVRLCDRSVVFGNIFAEDDVVIGDGCRVLGTIFAQGDVVIGENAVLGTEYQLRSIVARGNISFLGRARIYGYVTTEGKGSIAADEDTGDEAEDRPKRILATIPPDAKPLLHVEPALQDVDAGIVSYRKDDRVVSALLPLGATWVSRSMFYSCKNLNTVSFPSTLLRIEGFSFFACTSLTTLDLRHCDKLTYIGPSAFEGCSSITHVLLPMSIEQIDEAAFRNCSALVKVSFARPYSLKSIGSHAFMGCSSLCSIHIPKTVTSIGLSAFYGCSNLRKLVIPDAIEEIGPYLVSECTSLDYLSVPKPLSDEESVGLPPDINIRVRNSSLQEAGEAQ